MSYLISNYTKVTKMFPGSGGTSKEASLVMGVVVRAFRFREFISDAGVAANLRVHSGTVAREKFSNIPRFEEKVLQ